MEHGNKIANGQWSESESKQIFIWHELKAVRLALESFQSKLENERVRWFTDNQNVVRIIQHGSRIPALQAEALTIFWCVLKPHSCRTRMDPKRTK